MSPILKLVPGRLRYVWVWVWVCGGAPNRPALWVLPLPQAVPCCCPDYPLRHLM